MACEEVGDDEAIGAEQAAERFFQQEGIRAGVLPFDQVVRAHRGGAVSLDVGHFKRRQLDLVQRALGDVDVDEGTAAVDAEDGRDPGLALLVVGGKVLDVRHHALGLEAVDPTHRCLS